MSTLRSPTGSARPAIRLHGAASSICAGLNADASTGREAPSFDPHTASDELWATFNETRRAIAHEFWPDEPILDDAETRREVQTNNPMVEFRRWVAMEGDEVTGSILAAFRRPGTPDEKDYARFVWAGGGVRASSRRRGVSAGR